MRPSSRPPRRAPTSGSSCASCGWSRTADPDAAIAFLESHDDVAARTEEFWRERTETAATSEIVGAVRRRRPTASRSGSLSVLVRATGQTDHLGRIVDDRRAFVVGVYVRPSHRGPGRSTCSSPPPPSGRPRSGSTSCTSTCIATTTGRRAPTGEPGSSRPARR